MWNTLGGFGIHKFNLGCNQQGNIDLGAFIGILCFGGFIVVSLIALVEGIIYLTMPIDQFKTTYIDNKKDFRGNLIIIEIISFLCI